MGKPSRLSRPCVARIASGVLEFSIVGTLFARQYLIRVIHVLWKAQRIAPRFSRVQQEYELSFWQNVEQNPIYDRLKLWKFPIHVEFGRQAFLL
jgi:hypothetical protein